jgi:sugar lactone lactonase YvrE
VKLVHDATASASPVWDVGSASLLWAEGTTVHRLHPASDTHAEIVVPQRIGAALPRTNGGLVGNLRDGIGLRDIDDRLTWLVYWHRDGAEAGPATIDPAGNLWAATGDQLIRVRPDGRATVVLDGVTITGIAAGDRLHIATAQGVAVFDPDTGDRTPLCAAPAAGLCVDADGGVWVAVPDANEIRRITPTGDLDRVLDVPGPTGCCFGGPDFTDLYLTAGPIFVVPTIGTGAPTPRFPG